MTRGPVPTHPVRVSVIVPARNAAATLGEALDSLLAQTVTGWEALVVDDTSDDDTPAVLDRYARADARIRALSGPGRGASAARNVGLEEARGEFLLFLDADDWISRDHMERLLGTLEADPAAALAFGRCLRVAPDGRSTPDSGARSCADHPFETMSRTCDFAIHAALVRREVVQRLGGFDTALRTCEDWDLWQRIARLGRPWLFADEVVSFYRLSPHSLTRNLRQLLADAAIVVRRGHGPDPRVPDAPAEFQRAPTSEDGWSADDILVRTSLWYAAWAIALADDTAPCLEALDALAAPPADHVPALAGTLAYGLAAGLFCDPAELGARWPGFAPALLAFLDRLAKVWDDPTRARALQYAIERQILELDPLSVPRSLGLTIGWRLAPDVLAAHLAPPPGVDRLLLRIAKGRHRGGMVDLGLLGRQRRRDLAGLLFDTYEPSERGGPAWVKLVLGVRRVERFLAKAGRGVRSRLPAVLREVGPKPRPGSHAAALRLLAAEAERQALTGLQIAPETPGTDRPSGDGLRGMPDRPGYWDEVFRSPDPWGYGSAYEQEKYEWQIGLLPDRPICLALELACAEGHFTRRLAPEVEHLVATDISEVALARAAERCRDLPNIEFRQLDLLRDPLPEGADLIVCSEVLYFLPDADHLARLAECLAAALAPGGSLITAHAFVLADDRSQTGFDWGNPFGATTIARVLEAAPGLALAESLRTELYRVDRFTRVAGDDTRPVPRVETVPIQAPLSPEVAAQVAWGGAAITRGEAARTEMRAEVPVLMYHRIAKEGPEALANWRIAPDAFREQLRWLRCHGYHAIDSGQLLWHMRRRIPIAGRPVLLSFDDGFQDFADTAWPMLRTHSFFAEVFVVTDLAGGLSEWDRSLGGAFPLMGPEVLARLQAEGVRFGSHLATHRGADGLGTADLAGELLRSRAQLGLWLGKPPVSFAAPFGRTDGRLRRLSREAGYGIGFSTESRGATLRDDPLNVPRITVSGHWTLEDFARAMEALL